MAGGLFPLVSLLFLLFVLLPVEELLCCPSVEQGLITQSTSAPAQISIETRPLPFLLCPTPAGGSWGMRNAEIRSPHSLRNCLVLPRSRDDLTRIRLAPAPRRLNALSGHGRGVCVCRQRQLGRFINCGLGRSGHAEVIVPFGVYWIVEVWLLGVKEDL